MEYEMKYSGGLLYVMVPRLRELGFINAFTTRLGGVSQPPYAELNLGFHTGDVREAVIENRMRVGKVLDFPLDSFVAGEQVHGEGVAIVTAGDKGRGARHLESALPETDALITEVPGVLLVGFFADCVPILIADPVRGGMGLIHAGWKGTVRGIALRCVEKMVEAFNSDPATCIAVIGPSIGPCCYYVQEDVKGAIEEAFLPLRYGVGGWESSKGREGINLRPLFYGGREGGCYFDLWEANKEELMAAGLLEEKILITRLCTSCLGQLFYSYRAERGRTGRIGAFIGRLSDV